jgi:hypothetical protein
VHSLVQRQMFGHIRWSFRQCLASGSDRVSSVGIGKIQPCANFSSP